MCCCLFTNVSNLSLFSKYALFIGIKLRIALISSSDMRSSPSKSNMKNVNDISSENSPANRIDMLEMNSFKSI